MDENKKLFKATEPFPLPKSEKGSWLATFPELNPTPIIEVDRKGKIHYINPSAIAAFPDSLLNTIISGVEKMYNDLRFSKNRILTKEMHIQGTWFYVQYLFRSPGRIIIYFININDLKKAEEELKQNEKLLARAQEISHLGSWELDIEKNELTWSDETYRIFGMKPKEIGMTYDLFLERVHPDDRNVVDKIYFESIKNKLKNYEIEHRIIHKDTGEIRWVQEKCEHEWDETGKIVRSAGMILDITERKKKDAKLEEQALMLAEANDAVIGYDGSNRVTYWNKAAERMYGYTAEEMIGKVAYDVLKTNYSGISREKFIEQIQRNNRAESESTRYTKSGKKIYIESHSIMRRDKDQKIIGVISTHRDVTKRKSHEEKLKEFGQRMAAEKAKDEALLSSIGHGVVAIDRNGKILFANRRMNYFLNKNYDTLVGKKIIDVLDIYNEKDRRISGGNRPIYLSLRGESHTLKDCYCLGKKNKKIYVNIVTSPVASRGKIIGAISVYSDVTKERQIEKAKTEFVSMASHQLRTPITEISLSVEMLLSGMAGKVLPEQKKYLHNITGGVREVISLVESLLNITRIQMGNFVVNPKPMELQSFFDKLITGFYMQIKKKKLVLKKYYPKKKIILNIDPNIAQLIFENLLSNAVKYTEKGHVDVRIEKNEKNVIIIVSDTGCGIPENQQHLVFTKLFRSDNALKNRTKGHGLGLHIVKSIVEKVGGRIRFESQEKRGTTFYVTLPLSGMKRKVQQSLI
jgi:PAS domain S-box-containing protein